ncbi:MAG TPA: hypothetical protein VFX86_01355 [Candidatus Saccharimonadales bacterium]|nr:hypothetical protein [Candidatus Saccharimonadales bacterium]
MPDIRPKTPETLHAQTAAFLAADGRRDDGQYFLLTATSADAAPLTAFASPISERAAALMQVEVEYLDFLKESAGKVPDSPVEQRRQLAENYEQFAPAVDALLEEIGSQDKSARQKHPAFVGGGAFCGAFEIEHGDKQYALRVPWAHRFNHVSIDEDYIQAGIKARGQPQLEQLVAISYEQGVTVAEIMPGKPIESVSVDDLAEVTDEQLEELNRTLMFLRDAGLEPELTTLNLFYDREKGFGIVDLEETDKQAEPVTAGDLINDAAIAMHAVVGNSYDERMTPKRRANKLKFYSVVEPIIERYRAVSSRMFSGDEGKEIDKMFEIKLNNIKSRIGELRAGYKIPGQIESDIYDTEERLAA